MSLSVDGLSVGLPSLNPRLWILPMTWQTWVCRSYSWYIRTIISSIRSLWPVSVFQLLMEPVVFESTPFRSLLFGRGCTSSPELCFADRSSWKKIKAVQNFRSGSSPPQKSIPMFLISFLDPKKSF